MSNIRRASRTPPITDDEIVGMILDHEGRIYTNHPADRGGPTKFGITQVVLAKWRGQPVTSDDVKALKEVEAASIYQHNYVRPFAGLGVTILRANVIDMGVNAGLRRATIILQQLVRAHVDGLIGPQTITAALTRDWNPLYVGGRIAFYERIIENDLTQLVWRNGWHNRAMSFYGAAHRLPLRLTGEPVFGHQGKAYLYAA